MFEHKQLDGEKHRLIPSSADFIKEEILEVREPKNGEALEATPRTQYAVVGDVLVERYLPSENIGDRWSHDAGGEPWWLVVNNPPNGGLVAEYNAAMGGQIIKPLDTEHNVVGFTEAGEEVLFQNNEYIVIRKSDEQELRHPSLVDLRCAYYSWESDFDSNQLPTWYSKSA